MMCAPLSCWCVGDRDRKTLHPQIASGAGSNPLRQEREEDDGPPRSEETDQSEPLAGGAGEEDWGSGVGGIGAGTRWGGTGFLQRARWSRHDGGDDQMADSNAGGVALMRVELREVLDGIRDEVVQNFATKADFENLKTWIVCTVLVAVVNLVGTVGVIVAFVLTG